MANHGLSRNPDLHAFAPTKRRKRPGPAQKACAPCRKQKLRCNTNENPCPHCQRRKVTCYYDSEYVSLGALGATTASSSPETRPTYQHNVHSTYSSAGSGSDSTPTVSSTSLDVPYSPTPAYSSKIWWDHLLCMFGGNRQSSHRMVNFLLRTAMTRSHYHWFDMWHFPTLRRAGVSERDREDLHPSLIFGMVAIGLRQRQSKQRPYGMGVGETLIPDETIPAAETPYDLSEQIKEAGNVYLDQDIASPHRNLQAWIDTAKAALMLMQLEKELSPRYLHLLGIATAIMRSSNLKETLAVEAKKTNSNQFQNSPLQRRTSDDVSRSSIAMEEAARLALLPIWHGTRVGIAFFNVELKQTSFTTDDVSKAYIFAPWPDEEPEESQRLIQTQHKKNDAAMTREAMSTDVRARTLGLNVMYTNLFARGLPDDLNYANPTRDLTSVLRNLDDLEFMFGMMADMVDWHEPSFFRMMMMRFCTSVSYLHGVVMRRVKLAHSDSLREAIVKRLQSQSDSSDGSSNSGGAAAATHDQHAEMGLDGTNDGVQGESRRNSSTSLRFESNVLRGWCQIQELYMTEMELDYLSYVDTEQERPQLRVSKFQCDVIRLYWLATQQFYLGVREALRLAGSDHRKDAMAQMLKNTAQGLERCVRRHDAAMNNSTFLSSWEGQQDESETDSSPNSLSAGAEEVLRARLVVMG